MRKELSEIMRLIMTEPNGETFQYKGFKCLIKRHPDFFSLNGYVGLPEGHKFYGKGYDDIDIDCHGGITFADHWEDQKDNLWYIGFDCAHHMDITPGCEMRLPLDMQMKISDIDSNVTYKNIEYVRNECKNIVDQLLK